MEAIATKTVRMDEVTGQCAAKRAAEVACAGKHSLTIIAIDGEESAATLARWAQEHGARAYTIVPCECGHYGSYHHPCECKGPDDAWDNADPLRADLVVVAMPEPVTEMLSRHSPEPDEAIAARITAARQRKQASGLTAEARILLERAGSRFGLTSGQLAQIIAVATTIATLDSAPYVGAQHVAEAVQYRRGRNYYAQ